MIKKLCSPQSYRSIVLISVSCKVMEGMILRVLKYFFVLLILFQKNSTIAAQLVWWICSSARTEGVWVRLTSKAWLSLREGSRSLLEISKFLKIWFKLLNMRILKTWTILTQAVWKKPPIIHHMKIETFLKAFRDVTWKLGSKIPSAMLKCKVSARYLLSQPFYPSSGSSSVIYWQTTGLQWFSQRCLSGCWRTRRTFISFSQIWKFAHCFWYLISSNIYGIAKIEASFLKHPICFCFVIY